MIKNKRGQSISDRLSEEFDYIKRLVDENQRVMLAYKALGAADIAIEFGLITYTEWEIFVKDFFRVA